MRQTRVSHFSCRWWKKVLRFEDQGSTTVAVFGQSGQLCLTRVTIVCTCCRPSIPCFLAHNGAHAYFPHLSSPHQPNSICHGGSATTQRTTKYVRNGNGFTTTRSLLPSLEMKKKRETTKKPYLQPDWTLTPIGCECGGKMKWSKKNSHGAFV